MHCLETPNSPAILTLLTYLLRGVGRHPPHDRRGVRHLRRLGAAARRRRQEAAAPAVPHAARALRPTAAAAAASAHASRSWVPRGCRGRRAGASVRATGEASLGLSRRAGLIRVVPPPPPSVERALSRLLCLCGYVVAPGRGGRPRTRHIRRVLSSSGRISPRRIYISGSGLTARPRDRAALPPLRAVSALFSCCRRRGRGATAEHRAAV